MILPKKLPPAPRNALAVLLVALSFAPVSADTGGLPPELRVIPLDGTFFATVRLAEVWNSELARPLRPIVQLQVGKQLQQYEKSIGLTLGDIERVSVVVLRETEQGPNWAVVITATRAYDRAKVLATLAPGAAETKQEGRSYYPVSALPGSVVHCFNDRTVVLGPRTDVHELLQRAAQPAKTGRLGDALALAARQHPVVVGFDFTSARKHVPANLPLEAAGFLPLLAMTHGTVKVDIKDSVQASARLHFADQNQARAGETAVRDLVAFGREELQNLVSKGKPDAQAQALLKRLDAWIAAVPARVDGATLLISPELKREDVPVALGVLLPVLEKVREVVQRPDNPPR